MTSSIFDAQTGADAEPSAPVGTSAVARWHWVQTKVLDHPDLTTAEICVAVVLASHVNDRTQNCFPKIETIAREASLSDRKVRQALKRLSELGLVAKRCRAVGRLRNRNAYQLLDLGAKPASGSLIPASDSAVKQAYRAGSNKKNTDKEENTDEKEQAPAVSGTGATVLPAVDDHCLVLAREWQRLCFEPWTLANACLRVNEAIERGGFEVVQQALDDLKCQGKRPSRLGLLDVLDGLVPESTEQRSETSPDPFDPSDPAEWQQICRIVAQTDIPGCRNPRAWLSQIRANITDNTIELITPNRCVQDTTRHQLMAAIRPVAERKGLQIGGVTCLN
ncbi:helix-turn-helix domain-containing protein [Thalassospira marina]|uniref:Replication protein n=1 Tax=Thalassospira marina TaxID=2048283 RepID=A0ABM6QAF8_9PROT|nr:helix-turn-helix domain-containing protein [Thalassospira marina]AUG53504.1 replication protein [Thalassospira marina]